MLARMVLEEVESTYIKACVPEKEGEVEGKWMETPEAPVRKTDADSSRPPFIVKFTISTKRWRGLIYEYMSLSYVHIQKTAVYSCCSLIIKRWSLVGGNVNIKLLDSL